MKDRETRSIFRIPLLYATFAGLWILLSDNMLELFVSDPFKLTHFQTYKGLVFVLASTALLVFLLLRHRSRTRQYLDAASVIISAIDRSGRVMMINKTGCDLLESDRKTVVGRDWFEFFAPDHDREQARNLFLEIMEGRTNIVENFECPVQPESGEPRNVSFQLSSLRNSSDHVVGVMFSGTDVTKRKSIEDKLIEREALLSDMGRIAKVGGWEFEVSTGKGTWTDEVARIHDIDPEKETDMNLGLSVYQDEHREKIERAINDAVKKGETYDLELEMITMKGAKKWVRTIGHPVIEDGITVRVRGSFQDITEKKAAREKILKLNRKLSKYAEELEQRVERRTAELKAAKEKAEDADRLKSVFLATMSHELRTPLNSILGFTGVLQQELPGPLNEEQRKQLGMVRNAGRHLLDLINDVLDISKIEAGQMDVELSEFRVGEVVGEVVDSLGKQATEKGLALTSEISPEVDMLKTDRRRYRQIVLNLLSNSVKFTTRGGVTIKCVVEGDRLLTSVEDTGVGIREEDAGKLFKPFSQIETNLAEKPEGTGLGLSISKRLVERLGGELIMRSEYGAGSVFEFSLPLTGPGGAL